MSDFLPLAGAWLLRSALAGGVLLLLAQLLVRRTAQPARQQRLGEWAAVAAVVAALLCVAPAWLRLPLPLGRPTESIAVAVVESALPPAPSLPNLPPRPQAMPAPFSAASTPSQPTVAPRAAVGPVVPRESTGPAVSPQPVAAPSAPAPSRFATLLAWLAVAYGVAALVLLGRFVLGLLAVRRLVQSSRPAPLHVARVFAALTPPGLRARVRVSDRLQVPLSCGLLRPTVLLPVGLACPGAGAALRWALVHELTHLVRRDARACWLFGLGQALYFYLPWFWWLRRRVRLCQEYVADAAAAAAGSSSEDYAQFLLGWATAPAVPATALGVIGNSSDLFRRITMLLQSPGSMERRCPRLWSRAAAAGLLSLAVLVSGVGAYAPTPEEEPAKKDEKKKDEAKPAEPKKDEAKPAEPKKDEPSKLTPKAPAEGKAEEGKKDAADDPFSVDAQIDQLMKNLPPGMDAETLKRVREQMKRTQIMMRQQQAQAQAQGLLPGPNGGNLPGGGFNVIVAQPPFGLPMAGMDPQLRLGVQISSPSGTLAQQLDLPKDQGLVIDEVNPGTPAAKAGLRAHDILLEIDGKPVSSDLAQLHQQLGAIKAKTPVDLAVLRKGKKEVIKGVTLPEAPAAPAFAAAPIMLNPGNFPLQPGLPGLPVPGFGGQQGVMTSMFRSNDNYTLRHQEGTLVITLTGKVENGKAKLGEIQVQDGGETKTYESVDKVPAAYREKVKNLAEMSEKNSIKIDVKVEP